MDGNTDDKDVQEKFISTLKETIKGDEFPVYYREDGGGDETVGTRGPESPAGGRTAAAVTGPAAAAVPRLNGFIPNNSSGDRASASFVTTRGTCTLK